MKIIFLRFQKNYEFQFQVDKTCKSYLFFWLPRNLDT